MAEIYVESYEISDFLSKKSGDLSDTSFVLAKNDTYEIRVEKTKSGFAFSAFNDGGFIESTIADNFKDCEICLEILYSKYIDPDYLVGWKDDEEESEEDAEYEKNDAILMAFYDFLGALIGKDGDAEDVYDAEMVGAMLGDTVDFLFECYGIIC